jgi:hypothetical protein
MSGQQLPLFAPEMVPEAAVPVPEWSPDWVVARILRATEDVLFNPDKLAKYEAKNPDGLAFLEFLVENCGGRSQ